MFLTLVNRLICKHCIFMFLLFLDLEKIAPKLKGITSMSVKDVVTSLVDDGMVDTDKIGTSVYFWAFPSKASANRKRKLDTLQDQLNSVSIL